jgi:hypothetical protein
MNAPVYTSIFIDNEPIAYIRYDLYEKLEQERDALIKLGLSMDKDFEQRIAELEKERDRYRDALESITEVHDGYCEHYIKVSSHSHSLSDIAKSALEGGK